MSEWTITILIFDVDDKQIGKAEYTRYFVTEYDAEAWGQKQALVDIKRYADADWWYVKVK